MSTIDINKKYIIEGSTLQDICDAVKDKTGASSIAVSDLSTSIESILTGDIYDGDYEVTPSVSQQIELLTKDDIMINNVTVKVVPYAEVSNPSGGKTVTIGG